MLRLPAAMLWLAACAGALLPTAPPPSAAPKQASTLQDEVDRLAREVAWARGREWTGPVIVRLMPPEKFELEAKRIAGRTILGFARELSQMFATFFFARSLDPDEFARAMREGAAGSGRLLLGLYDFETKSILVRKSLPDETELTGDQRAEVLAHELGHALQDQIGGLDAFRGARTWDAALAANALVEGDATVTENLVMGRRHGLTAQTTLQVASYLLQTGRPPGRFAKLDAPAAARAVMEFVYGDGTRLALGLWRSGGTAALDLALAHPPPSSSAVLHPEPWLAGKQLDALPAGADTLASGSFGAMFLRMLLEMCGAGPAAVRLAHVYRGDHYELRRLPSGERQLQWSTHWASAEAATFARWKLSRLPQCWSRRDLALKKLGEDVVNVVVSSRVLQVQGGAPSEREAALKDLRRDDSLRETIWFPAPLTSLRIPRSDLTGIAVPREWQRVQGRRWTSAKMGLTAELPESTVSWAAPWVEMLAYEPGPRGFVETVRAEPPLDAAKAGELLAGAWDFHGLICLEPVFSDVLPRSCPGLEEPVQRLRSGPVDLGWSQGDEIVERMGGQTLRQRVLPACGGKGAFLFRAWYEDEAGGAAADAWERSIRRLDAEPALCAQLPH